MRAGNSIDMYARKLTVSRKWGKMLFGYR